MEFVFFKIKTENISLKLDCLMRSCLTASLKKRFFSSWKTVTAAA